MSMKTSLRLCLSDLDDTDPNTLAFMEIKKKNYQKITSVLTLTLVLDSRDI